MEPSKIIGAFLLAVGAICGLAIAATPFGLSVASGFAPWALFFICVPAGAIAFTSGGSSRDWGTALRLVSSLLVVIGLSSLLAIMSEILGAIAPNSVGIPSWTLFLGCLFIGLLLSRLASSLSSVPSEISDPQSRS